MKAIVFYGILIVVAIVGVRWAEDGIAESHANRGLLENRTLEIERIVGAK